EHDTPAEVARDCATVSGSGVCASERLAAESAVVGEPLGREDRRIDGGLHVPELPHVEIMAIDFAPPEEDVARGLDPMLPVDTALSVGCGTTSTGEGLQHRHAGLLDLEEEWVPVAVSEQEHDEAASADAADSDDLSRNVNDSIATEQPGPVGTNS